MALMEAVLEKIASLIVDGAAELLGVPGQLRFLRHELSSMHAALEDVDDMDNPDNVSKAWRYQLMELAYDTEACIDDFRRRIEGPHGGQGFKRGAGRLLRTLMARYQISGKIAEIKIRVQEVNDRHKRYRLDGCASRSAHVSIYPPRMTTLYAETSSLVGIDAPKEEVIRLLTEADAASLRELRVVSIVGFGGLGKTTLANEVYRDLSGSFTCKAIISVSQRPEMMSLLKSLFSKVSGQEADRFDDPKDLIDNLREYLQGKRYLIVVDDLWDGSAWKILKCALPDNHCGSRVLTTTRIESVASASCNGQWKFIYKIKPLDDYRSRRQLFLRTIFGPGYKCPESLEGLCEEILKNCGGMPLAIIIIASLLTSQPTKSIEQWKYVLDYLRHNMGLNLTLEGVIRILNLSYTHLPRPLQACLLYIGTYPEGHIIQRDDLVSRWVAEGFINGVGRWEATQVARRYLNELVKRNKIIQIQCGSYVVHDLVLDFILAKSKEENFLRVVRNI
ncbi:hypothetical protein BS78_05G039600 [Paspalum vaginatum]|nr:hypothetical protein BS78_05G039600 [Paspalum vaginatum]